MPSHPSVPEPSTPAAVPATHSGPTTSLSPEALLQEVKSTVESSFQAMVGKPSKQPVQSTSLPAPVPTPPVPPSAPSLATIPLPTMDQQPPQSLPSFSRRSRSHRHRTQSKRPDKRPVSIHRSPRRRSIRRPTRSSRPRTTSRDRSRRRQDSRPRERASSVHLRSATHRRRAERHTQEDHYTNHMTTPPQHQLFMLPSISHSHTNPLGSTTPHPSYQTAIHVTTPTNLSLPTCPHITPLNPTSDDPLQPLQETTTPSPLRTSLQAICSSMSIQAQKMNGCSGSSSVSSTKIECQRHRRFHRS